MDAATPVFDQDNPARGPKAGDVCVCLKCGELLTFTEALGLRVMDLNDMLQVLVEDQHLLMRAQSEVRRQRYLG